MEPSDPVSAVPAKRDQSGSGQRRAAGSSPTYSTTQQIGRFNCAPVFGGVVPNAVFEYGTGRRNVSGFTHTISADGLVNSAYHLPTGFPDSATQNPLNSTDARSIASRGLYEEVIGVDLADDTLRQRLIDEHVAIRARPREVITFQPVRDDGSGRVPQFGIDYSVGDVVPFRAIEEGQVTVDGFFRIYAAEFAIDDTGASVPTFTLIDDDATA